MINSIEMSPWKTDIHSAGQYLCSGNIAAEVIN
jgi:hypothetical protein